MSKEVGEEEEDDIAALIYQESQRRKKETATKQKGRHTIAPKKRNKAFSIERGFCSYRSGGVDLIFQFTHA